VREGTRRRGYSFF